MTDVDGSSRTGSVFGYPVAVAVQQGSASIGSFRCIALQVLPRSPTNMAESTQHKLDRIRPPRVQITYDVEIGNAIEKKELPLVVGILADLSGKPETPLPKLIDRRFTEIDRDNFNEVLASIEPRSTLQVENTISGDGSKLNVELRFRHFDDFDPVNIVNQITPLRRLYEARQRLRDLLTKLDGNDDLDKLLQDVVSNTEGLQEIKSSRPESESPAQAAVNADVEAPVDTPASDDGEAPTEPQA